MLRESDATYYCASAVKFISCEMSDITNVMKSANADEIRPQSGESDATYYLKKGSLWEGAGSVGD